MPTPRKKVDKDSGIVVNANDADDARSIESANAEKVRNGELSAAQMGDNNIPGTDIQMPPGIVETAAAARAKAGK